MAAGLETWFDAVPETLPYIRPSQTVSEFSFLPYPFFLDLP